MTLTTDPPTGLHTATDIPPLPSAFDAPLATGEVHTPAVAIIILVAVIILALVLLVALGYFILLRLWGKCPHCPEYEDELKKYKDGTLKYIDPSMVQLRPHNCDLEKGSSPFDGQAEQYKIRMRGASLANLEGRHLNQVEKKETAGDQASRHLRDSQIQAAKGKRDSGWSSDFSNNEESTNFEKEREQFKEHTLWIDVPEPAPAHLPAPVVDDQEHLVNNPALRNPNFNGTYEEYERDILGEREKERKLKSIAGWMEIVNDPNTPEAKAVRAMATASTKMAEMESNVARKYETTVAPREAGRSRFRERFSLASHIYIGGI